MLSIRFETEKIKLIQEWLFWQNEAEGISICTNKYSLVSFEMIHFSKKLF